MTIKIIIDQAQDMLLILPHFNSDLYIHELLIYTPHYSNFLSQFDQDLTLAALHKLLSKIVE